MGNTLDQNGRHDNKNKHTDIFILGPANGSVGKCTVTSFDDLTAPANYSLTSTCVAYHRYISPHTRTHDSGAGSLLPSTFTRVLGIELRVPNLLSAEPWPWTLSLLLMLGTGRLEDSFRELVLCHLVGPVMIQTVRLGSKSLYSLSHLTSQSVIRH